MTGRGAYGHHLANTIEQSRRRSRSAAIITVVVIMIVIAGIPRRRHGHHREDPREEIACVGRKILAVLGESVSGAYKP